MTNAPSFFGGNYYILVLVYTSSELQQYVWNIPDSSLAVSASNFVGGRLFWTYY